MTVLILLRFKYIKGKDVLQQPEIKDKITAQSSDDEFRYICEGIYKLLKPHELRDFIYLGHVKTTVETELASPYLSFELQIVARDYMTTLNIPAPGGTDLLCQNAPYIAEDVSYATGNLVLDSNTPTKKPLICGGTDISENVRQDCYNPEDPFLSFDNVIVMSIARSGAASIVVNGGTKLWITGGGDAFIDVYDSTEYITPGSDPASSPGPSLPKPLERHCMVQLEDGTAIVIGGRDDWSYLNERTFFYSPGSNEFQDGPQLRSLKVEPACGVIKDGSTGQEVVIVAGGRENEFGDIDAEEWSLVHSGKVAVLYIPTGWNGDPTILDFDHNVQELLPVSTLGPSFGIASPDRMRFLIFTASSTYDVIVCNNGSCNLDDSVDLKEYENIGYFETAYGWILEDNASDCVPASK